MKGPKVSASMKRQFEAIRAKSGARSLRGLLPFAMLRFGQSIGIETTEALETEAESYRNATMVSAEKRRQATNEQCPLPFPDSTKPQCLAPCNPDPQLCECMGLCACHADAIRALGYIPPSMPQKEFDAVDTAKAFDAYAEPDDRAAKPDESKDFRRKAHAKLRDPTEPSAPAKKTNKKPVKRKVQPRKAKQS